MFSLPIIAHILQNIVFSVLKKKESHKESWGLINDESWGELTL